MLTGLRAQESLGKAIVDDVYQTSILLSLSDQDVLWLEITMKEGFCMHLLQSDQELVADVEDSPDGEGLFAELE